MTPNFKTQRGSTLFITLIMLVLLMITGSTTMVASVTDLRVAGNTRDSIDAFQKAEAGINAVNSLIGTANDPLDGTASNPNPFSVFDGIDNPVLANPLLNVTNVAVSTILDRGPLGCVRGENASSRGKIDCEYYTARSVHLANSGSSAIVAQGTQREIIAK